MPDSSSSKAQASELLRELEVVRARLEQSGEWFKRPDDTMTAGALAKEVERLCYQASRSESDAEITVLLAQARESLDAVQRLLGAH